MDDASLIFTRVIHILLHLATAFFVAPLIPGVINKTKAMMAGRQGPRLLQTYFDLRKFIQKRALYSQCTTWIFLLGPIVTLSAVSVAALLVPFGHFPAPIHFEGDAILFAYLFGLIRLFTVMSALDTGSSFEGMGASRELRFAAIAEPALFLGFAAMAKSSGSLSLSSMLASPDFTLSKSMAPTILILTAWMVVYLLENARIPVDDPNTHLELTMIHEVMVLDHSGRPMALIVYGQSLKLLVLGALILGPLLPRTEHWWLDWLAFYGGLMGLAITVGLIESALARFQMNKVSQFLTSAILASAFAFLLLLV